MTVGVILIMVGGFWTLAYIPIDRELENLKQQIVDIRKSNAQHFANDDVKFLTQKEHIEFNTNINKNIDRLSEDLALTRKDIETRRVETATRQDLQNALNTTRVEFLSEVKRLDQATADNMKRREFEAWKAERDKTIASIQDRQNRFTEALDAMYSRIMQQTPTYAPRQ